MEQSRLYVLEGTLYIIGGILWSLNFFSNSSGMGALLVLGVFPFSAGAVLKGLRERRRGRTKVFIAQLGLASGMILTGLSGYLPVNIYTDSALLIGLILIGISTIYIWFNSVIPDIKNAINQS